MATQVAIEDLSTWLSNQPANTIDTPYEIEVTGITLSNIENLKTLKLTRRYVDLSTTVLPNGLTDLHTTQLFVSNYLLVKAPILPTGLTDMQGAFSSCRALKEAPAIPNTVTNLDSAFKGCTNLVTPPIIQHNTPVTNRFNETFMDCTSLISAPIIPDSATYMNWAFLNCTSLKNAPVIPNGVTRLARAFENCTSLEYKPIIPSSATYTTDCFKDVTQTRFGGLTSQLESFVANQTTEFDIVEIEEDAVNNCYKMTGKEVYGVDVSNLATWLSEHEENTVDTPYEIKILGLTTNNLNTMKASLIGYSTRYVDLGYTVMTSEILGVKTQIFGQCSSLVGAPTFAEGVTTLNQTFFYCSNLKKVPLLPSSLTTMSAVFVNCTSLITAPQLPVNVTDIDNLFVGCSSLVSADIPSGVTNMGYTFQDCTSLKNAPTLPSSVTELAGCFRDCTSLEKPPVIPSGVTSLYRTFYGCSSLCYAPNIPNTVTDLEGAFSGCSKIRHIFNSKTVAGVAIYHSTHIDMRTAPTIGAMNKDYGSNVENSVTGNDFAHNEYSGCDLSDNVTVSQTIDTLDSDGKKSRIYIAKRSSDDKIVVLAQQNYYIPAVRFWDADDITVNSNGNLSVPQGTYWSEHESGGFYTDSTKTTLINTDYFPASYDGMYDRDFFNIGDTFYFESPNYEDYNGTYEVLVNDAVFKTTLGIDYTDGHDIVIPASVTYASECFKGCTALEEIAEFLIPLNTLKNNANFQNMFQNCTSLRQIGHKVATEQHWHVMSLNIGASAVSGKVYDSEGNATTIPSTSVTKTNLVMSNITDEILFPPVALSDADLEDVILDVLANKYTWWKREAIDPTQKTFVLYADDPENVITNIAGGTNIKVYDTQAQAEADLANLSEGQIIATEMGGDGAVDEVIPNDTRVVTSGAVSDSLSYSTTEQKTGGKWIDGKPIYRKVNQYELSSTSDTYFDLGLLNIQNVKTIINAQGIRIVLNDYSYQVLNSTIVLYNGHLYIDKSWTGNIGPCFIILEYTKTTD